MKRLLRTAAVMLAAVWVHEEALSLMDGRDANLIQKTEISTAASANSLGKNSGKLGISSSWKTDLKEANPFPGGSLTSNGTQNTGLEGVVLLPGFSLQKNEDRDKALEGSKKPAEKDSEKTTKKTSTNDSKEMTEADSTNDSEKMIEPDSTNDPEKMTETDSADDSKKMTETDSADHLEKITEADSADHLEKMTETDSADHSEKITEADSADHSEKITEADSAVDTEEMTATDGKVQITEWLSEDETDLNELETDGESYSIYTYIDKAGHYLMVSPKNFLLPSFQELQQDLNDMISEYEGSWSIYVKDLKSSISLTINDRPQDSASLIKLYIAGAVLEEIRDQKLTETDTIDRLLSEMISLSDNEASNELVRYLSDEHNHRDGLEKVNQFIAEHGFTDTHQYNGLEDPNLWYEEEANVTSVKDCGRFLEEIYDGDMINHLSSRQIEGYLLDQDITWKIPAGIPSEIKTANKTGEKDNTQNDVSIVYTPTRDYILCVMSTDLTDEDTAIENIRAISSKVYEFFQEADRMMKVTEYAVDDSDMEVESEEADDVSYVG